MNQRIEVPRRDVLRGLAGGSLAAAIAGCAPPDGIGPSKPVEDWHVTDFASRYEIAGYVDRPSLNRGEDIVLHLNCTGADAGGPVKVAVHRTGWYDGVGAETLRPTVEVTAPAEQAPTSVVDPTTNQCEANWAPVLTIPTRSGTTPWPSGVYVIQLTARSGKQSYVPFTLRDDASTASVLVVQSHLTWQAYNTAGGHDLYNRGAAVSFRRPYRSDGIRWSQGAGEYLWLEYRVVRWLERNGFDVTYVADFDLHRAPVPASTKVILLSGHPEYWTGPMRRNVETAMATRGTGLVALAANTCYWRGRMEGATATHPGRYVLWKTDDGFPPPEDPLRDDPELASRLWRTLPGQAEQALLGGGFRGWLDANAYIPGPTLNSTALVADDVSHAVFDGTGIRRKQTFPGLCGGEYDWLSPTWAAPAITTAFTTPLDWIYSSWHDITKTEYQQSALHEKVHPGGVTSRVFNAGTFAWAWGLDDFSLEPWNYRFANPQIQHLTSNIIRWAAKEL
jgi:hypothetical protein